MKSLQLLAGMSLVALLISGCSTWNNTMGAPMKGETNPNTGKYTPPPPPVMPPK